MAKPDWITLNKTSGGGSSETSEQVQITAEYNLTAEGRTGSLTINSENTSTSKTVSISQDARPKISVIIGNDEAGVYVVSI